MRSKNVIYLAIIVVITIIAGCTGESANTAKPAQINTMTEDTRQKELLANVVTASVMTVSKNWDADSEDDGIVVHPNLKDSNGETVKFEKIELPVVVKIYTKKLTSDYKEVNDRLVYEGTSTINSWKDGNFLFSGGIKVPYEDINTMPSDKEFGRVYVTVTLPDGRNIEAKDDIVRIKP